MTSAENSVSEPPNSKKIFSPDPPKRIVPSALEIMPPFPLKNPSYGPGLYPWGTNNRNKMSSLAFSLYKPSTRPHNKGDHYCNFKLQSTLA